MRPDTARPDSGLASADRPMKPSRDQHRLALQFQIQALRGNPQSHAVSGCVIRISGIVANVPGPSLLYAVGAFHFRCCTIGIVAETYLNKRTAERVLQPPVPASYSSAFQRWVMVMAWPFTSAPVRVSSKRSNPRLSHNGSPPSFRAGLKNV